MPPPNIRKCQLHSLVVSRQSLVPGIFPRPFLQPLADLLCPALVNGSRDDVVEVLGIDVADEEDLDVVFHGDQL